MRDSDRKYRAGDSVEDVCRACKLDRMHTVIVVDGDGRPLRVSCGYCDSEHNYRGGPAVAVRGATATAASTKPRSGEVGPTSARVDSRASYGGQTRSARNPFPLVTDRERTAPPVTPQQLGDMDFELLLRRIIREESGLTPVTPAEKWRNGQLVLRPGTPGLQEKTWPVETFFHKVVMLRNRLRTLEQQINAAEMPEDLKVKLQGYVTGCYGTLTSFNVLFADEDDQFRGAGTE